METRNRHILRTAACAVAVIAAAVLLRCRVFADCRGDEAGLSRAFPAMRIVPDEDGGADYLLPLEGGGTA